MAQIVQMEKSNRVLTREEMLVSCICPKCGNLERDFIQAISHTTWDSNQERGELGPRLHLRRVSGDPEDLRRLEVTRRNVSFSTPSKPHLLDGLVRVTDSP